MARSIKDRDQHCLFQGCTHTQNLQIHHIRHWPDNGETSIENGVCACQFHHTLLH
ncbi:MAG: HNH endonuclease [Granulosicoccus sp.]